MKNPLYISGANAKVPAHLNFGKFLLDAILKHGDAVALHNMETGIKVTYRELAQYAVNISGLLTELGVKKDDIVGLGTEAKPEFLFTLLGVVTTGATVTPFEIECGPTNLQHKLAMIKPKFVISSEVFWNKYSSVLKSNDFILKFISLDEELCAAMNGKNLDVDLFEPEVVKGQDDVAMVMYSSGTTGMPKGVLMTHLNCILYSSPQYYENISLQRIWIMLHWVHNYGLFKAMKCLGAGKTIVYPPADQFHINGVPKHIQESKVEMIITSPDTLLKMLKSSPLDQYNLDSLKIIYSRSSPLGIENMKEAKKRFAKLEKFMQGYGMTEAGELSSEFAAKELKPGSVGVPTEGITFKVVDPNTRKILGPNQHGELCINGPVVMKGYVDVDRSNYLDEEGFFKTGDLGYYDDDHYIYIIDRLKDIIMCCGFNTVPSELESLLLTHPGVREVGVVGKADPIEFEVAVAFVAKQPGSQVTEEQLMTFVNAEVPPYKEIREVKFISEIPRNVRGKILRSSLKDMLTREQ